MYIAKRITAFLAVRGIISEEKQNVEIYEYGLELILADFINFGVILLISSMVQGIGSGILYLLCFVSVRIFSGGFHAKTHLMCGMSMVIFYLLFVLLCRGLIFAQDGILIVGTVLAYLPLLKWAPVRNDNRPLSEKTWRKNRYRAVIVYSLWVLLAVILTSFGIRAGREILFALWLVSINIIFARFVHFCGGRRRT